MPITTPRVPRVFESRVPCMSPSKKYISLLVTYVSRFVSLLVVRAMATQEVARTLYTYSTRSTGEVLFDVEALAESTGEFRWCVAALCVFLVLFRVVIYGDYRKGDLEKRLPPLYAYRDGEEDELENEEEDEVNGRVDEGDGSDADEGKDGSNNDGDGADG